MTIQLFTVPPATADQCREHMAKHYDRPLETWEFAADVIKEPVTFSTIVTLDTLAPVINAFSKSDHSCVRTLASGWSYVGIDIDNSKNIDILFSAPENQNEGFVLRLKPSTFMKDEIGTLSAHFFTDRKFWYPSRKDTVIEALSSGKSRIKAFEYSPQTDLDLTRGRLVTHGPHGDFDPEGVLRIMPPLVEALSAFDPVLFEECVAKHSAAVYNTLFEEKQDILTATRGVMSVDGHVSGTALARMVNILWRTGMGIDLQRRLGDVDGLFVLLREQQNLTAETEFDFDDDKYGAYVNDEASTVFFRHEEDAISIQRIDDRLTICEVDYATGQPLSVYCNMSIMGDKVVEVHDAAPFNGFASSIIRRWVREIEGLSDMLEEDAVPDEVFIAPKP